MPPARNPWKSALCWRCGRCGRYFARHYAGRLSGLFLVCLSRPRSFKALSNAVEAAAWVLDDQRALTIYGALQNGLYTHTDVRQAVPLIMDRGCLTPAIPLPLIGILTKWRASTRAHLYAHVQHMVVDLEEPRSLRATIGWPVSGAMRHLAYQLLRIPLPGTSVNKTKKAEAATPRSLGLGRLLSVRRRA